MEEEARKRKERLLLMKRKLAAQEEVDGAAADASTSEVESEVKKPTFRSYQPTSEELKQSIKQKDTITTPVHVEPLIEEQLIATQDESVIDDVDLTKLQPRKIDWDLKRDVTKRLDKLERRTQRAIAEMIRDRISVTDDSQERNQLFAAAVSRTAELQERGAMEVDSDEE